NRPALTHAAQSPAPSRRAARAGSLLPRNSSIIGRRISGLRRAQDVTIAQVTESTESVICACAQTSVRIPCRAGKPVPKAREVVAAELRNGSAASACLQDFQCGVPDQNIASTRACQHWTERGLAKAR